MKRFNKFLIESEDVGSEYSPTVAMRRGKAPTGAVSKAIKRSVIDPVAEYAQEVGSGFAADPGQFTKEFAKSMATDPQTYHSALQAAGMVPYAGFPADVADAALYAAQGDTDQAKLSLAMGIPGVGLAGQFFRGGRAATQAAKEIKAATKAGEELKSGMQFGREFSPALQSAESLRTGAEAATEPIRISPSLAARGQYTKATDIAKDLRSSAKEWMDTADSRRFMNAKYHDEDPFTAHFLNTSFPASGNMVRDLENLGAVIPDISRPAATTTGRELLGAAYGTKADTFVDLAARAQRKYAKGNPSDPNLWKFDPTKATEFVAPDYSRSVLDKPVDVYLGTHTPVDRSSYEMSDWIIPGHEGAASFNPTSITNPGKGSVLVNISAGDVTGRSPTRIEDLRNTLGHEWTHFAGHENPNLPWGKAVADTRTSADPAAAMTDVIRNAYRTERQAGTAVPQYATSIPTKHMSWEEGSSIVSDMTFELPRGTSKHIMNNEDFASLPDSIKSDLERIFASRGVDPEMLHRNYGNLRAHVNQKIEDSVNANKEYLHNREIPSQIYDVKSWMAGKGLPHIDSNMTPEEASSISKMILDKVRNGQFPELQGRPHMLRVIDMMADPQGKKLFDMISLNKKGSDVENKIRQIQMA